MVISFDGVPAGKSTEEIAKLSRSAIETRFNQQPVEIVIKYTSPKSLP